MKVIELTGTTDASGDLVITGTKKVIGFLEKISMIDNVTAGADLTFSSEYNGSVLIQANAGSAAKTWHPRSLGNKSTDGTVFTNVAEKFFFANEGLDLTIAQGGSAVTLRFLAFFSNNNS